MMSGGVSYYGSKISLISNANIRYEGHLFSVDTNESTVTLSKVRSFGTEERVTDHPVAQRDEMYDYIVFRGSDIKDLLVCESPKQQQNTSISQDPAILQHSGAVSTTTGPTPSFRPPNTIGAPPAPFAPFSMPYQYGAIGGMLPGQFGALQAQRPGGGRHTPPIARKSPTMEQAVQASGPQSPNKDKDDKIKKEEERGHQEPQPQRRRGSREEQRRQNRDYRESNRDFREQNRDYREQNRDYREQNRDNRDSRDVRDDGYRPRDRDYQDRRDRDGDRDGNRRRIDRPNRESRDQGRNQQQQYRRGGRGARRGNRPPMSKEPIKVGTDFDFDNANAQFDKEAFEDEFESKLKIVNGDEKAENEGSGSETPTSETLDDKFYEPEKSFFDSISCESTTPDSRTRPSRREEYKMNTETFGVPFARGRGRGRGGYYRGGFRGGYQGNYNRSGGGYRGRGNYRGGSNWNNRRNTRNQDWSRGDGNPRRDRNEDNRKREEGFSKGSSANVQSEGIKVAEGS